MLAGLAPFAGALWSSLHVGGSWEQAPRFSGLENYLALAGDRGFPLAAGIGLLWTALTVALTVPAAYILASFAHGSRKAYAVLFPLLAAAWATPVYIGAPLWRFLLHGAAGESVFKALTGITVNLMSDPVAAFVSTAAAAAWFRLPQAAFILLAAMGRSRRGLDEAAALDGAGPAALAFSLRLPSMAGSIAVVAALEGVAALKEFTVPFLMTAGGPPLPWAVTERTVIGATTTLEIYLYDLFSSFADSGVVAAYTVVMSLVVTALVALTWMIRSRLTALSRAGEPPAKGRPRSPRIARGGSRFWIPGRLSDGVYTTGALAMTVILSAIAALMLWCMLWMAFSGLSVAFVDGVLPAYPSADNFRAAFVDDGLALSFLNTFLVSAVTTALTVLVAFPAAAWLSDRGPGAIAAFFAGLQILSGSGGVHSLIPLYELWRKLGIASGYLPVVLVYAYHSVPVTVLALSAFLRDKPASFRDAAKLEGLGGIGYMAKIQLPLALPAIGASAMIAFLSAWNGFLAPLVFLGDDRLYTIAVKLHAYVGSIASGSPRWNRFAAASLVNILVVGLLFYRFKKPLAKSELAEHAADD